MIFESPIFTELILPFLLIFVLVFAILQKSKILGENKAQIDALVSLAIGILSITLPSARNFVVNVIPWLAVGLAVIFVFYLLAAFAGINPQTSTGLKITFGVLIGLFVLGVVTYVSGFGDKLSSFFLDSESLWSNLILLVIIGGAFAVAVSTTKSKSDNKNSQ